MVLLIFGQLFLVGAVLQEKLPRAPEPATSSATEVKMRTPQASEGTETASTPAGQPASALASNASPIEVRRPFRKPLPVTILGITRQDEEPFSAIEFDLAAPVQMKVINHERKLLRMRIAPPLLTPATATRNEIASRFEKLNWVSSDRYTELVIHGKEVLGRPSLATSPAGLPRLSLPYLVPGSKLLLQRGEEIATGLTYYTDRAATKSGQSDVFVLRVKPETSLVVFPTLANEGISQRETLSSMARRYQAIAGINAAYFTPKGEPIGTMIIDRRLVSSPYFNRSVFGINARQEAVFGHPNFSGVLRWQDREIGIDAINTPRRDDHTLVVYTPEFARSTQTSGRDSVELILAKSRVIGIRDTDSLIPPDGVVISATGDKAQHLRRIRLGDLVELSYQVADPWNQINHAVCGGPRLVTDGKVDVGQDERFAASIITGRHPRTAVALTWEGDLLFVVADGRSRQSSGMTLSELASYLRKCGARHAMNLDGGGSSAMWVQNRIVNRPSDGKERPISNGLLIGTKR